MEPRRTLDARPLRHDDVPAAAGAEAALPLVLLHGAVQTRAIWPAQVAALSGLRRIVVPDLRGHGQTPLGNEPLTIRLMAEDVLALMSTLGIERAAICGVSLGGMIALDMAAAAPERVAALVLSNTPRSLTSIAWLRRILAASDPQRLLFPIFGIFGRERTARFGLRLARLLVGPQWVGESARRHFVAGFSAMPADAIVATYGAIVDHRPLDPALVGCPCLVVEGDDDAGSIRAQTGDLARRLRRARHVVLDAGHVATLDDPPAFNRILTQFLQSLDGPASPSRPGDPGI